MVDKETLPVYEKVNKEAKSSKDNNTRLNRIEELNEKGNLGIPILNSVLKTISKGVFGASLDVTGLMTADAQELDKLSSDFIKSAKDLFGARLTDADLSAFMKTIPNLSQTKEGRSRVIKNLKVFNTAASLRKHAMDEIIKERGGTRPRDLESLIEQRVGPQLDALSETFASSPTESKAPNNILGDIANFGAGLLKPIGNMLKY